jgi:hypothetical protein
MRNDLMWEKREVTGLRSDHMTFASRAVVTVGRFELLHHHLLYGPVRASRYRINGIERES